MTNQNNGGPAFPCEGGMKFISGNDIRKTVPSNGMTLRDYFAAKAMQGLISKHGFISDEINFAAEQSYVIADAMLKERNK